MVRVWYIDDNSKNKDLELQRSPPQHLSLEELYKRTGIQYYKLESDSFLEEIRESRGYIYEDVVEITKETLHKYANEHMHSDDESRLVLEGSGYFDARDAADQWVRIEVCAGDMLILPAGIYHRFTLPTETPIRLRRFFTEETEWRAINRLAASAAHLLVSQ